MIIQAVLVGVASTKIKFNPAGKLGVLHWAIPIYELMQNMRCHVSYILPESCMFTRLSAPKHSYRLCRVQFLQLLRRENHRQCKFGATPIHWRILNQPHQEIKSQAALCIQVRVFGHVTGF
jgi:hypothetical protein